MNNKNDGGPAFPFAMPGPSPYLGSSDRDQADATAFVKAGRSVQGHFGMSLRDYFAAAALQGMIASPPFVDRATVNKANWAKLAYDWADAMLDVRKGSPDA